MPARLLSTNTWARSQAPILDFLAPRALTPRTLRTATWPTWPTPPTPRRHHSTAIPPSNAPTPDSTAASHLAPPSAPNPSPPIHPLSAEQRAFLSSALRVNQTGELAAILIYAAQSPVLTRSHPHLRPLMKHMYDQEAGHYAFFNDVIRKHRIRPTAMTPVWTAAASFLGWGTALLGREAAMACTEAVETEIGTHYNEQVRVLLDWARKCEESGQTLGPELEALVGQLRRIRDEELEHLDHAVENDAKEAKPYELLTEAIRAGCRGAIWVSERV
ncbi:ubiquinone biosynthesis monooxygenase Coq7 [Ascochyta rabiei]|uniref:5-demethoxyubiquinone hydroxylase, mitochondrial n=1 Tax=Didymella rabiei TaxID=5454 RepID=A0A163FGI9_DIDRA|nr:ubiquinone biosynthesis monooxygenase Coq7 [Ascochyta rabiei]KZM24348.1 oxidation-reduction process [Ascochyta rabiei]UPX15168.1 ubiquinone biosynthesis monooxygenase Coq7 [Ascochyta rabiei]